MFDWIWCWDFCFGFCGCVVGGQLVLGRDVSVCVIVWFGVLVVCVLSCWLVFGALLSVWMLLISTLD